MSAIGAAEKKTQSRVVQLLVGELGYEYLGNWSEGDHQNVLEGHLEHFLFAYQGLDREGGEALLQRAVAEAVKAAGNTSLNLYDRNKEFYKLRRGSEARLGRARGEGELHRLEAPRAQPVCHC